jgi:hypothetical protein
MKTSAEGKKFECLLVAARQIVADFNTYGEVLQMGDNGEYGVESAIGSWLWQLTKLIILQRDATIVLSLPIMRAFTGLKYADSAAKGGTNDRAG